MIPKIQSVCIPKKLLGIYFQITQLSTNKSVGSTAGSASIGKKRFRVPVETNPQILMKTCSGANYFKEGEEIKLKEDSEYPDWLWELSPVPKKLHEYDPKTKEYWEKAIIVGRQREWKLKSVTKNDTMIVDENILHNLEISYRRRFRALAKYHYNAGSDVVAHTLRVDQANLHKKNRYILPDDPRPFYPGIDEIHLPHSVAKMLIFSKDKRRFGRLGV